MAYVALMETTTGTLTVGQVARLTGVTVRTLHHYDEISLLTPGDRSSAGYRRYIGEDLDRLHRILGYRALGLSLESIAEILDDRGTSAEAHLRRQRELVRASVERLEELLETIDKELEGLNVGINLTPEERFEVFGDLPEFDKLDEYSAEAERRWGETDAWRDSQQRTASYGKEEWQRIRDQGTAIEQRLAEALRAGTAPTDAAAIGLAEEHRRHIGCWFYDCPLEMHVGLTRMYVDDPRFTAHYVRLEPGLAAYVRDAAAANAAGSG
ncbi:MAG: MerR family transcriptional regulator [Actinomycetota bacterium]|nr:MerR family transcriptional regulator [Actinomycetota bacterium]